MGRVVEPSVVLAQMRVMGQNLRYAPGALPLTATYIVPQAEGTEMESLLRSAREEVSLAEQHLQQLC